MLNFFLNCKAFLFTKTGYFLVAIIGVFILFIYCIVFFSASVLLNEYRAVEIDLSNIRNTIKVAIDNNKITIPFRKSDLELIGLFREMNSYEITESFTADGRYFIEMKYKKDVLKKQVNGNGFLIIIESDGNCFGTV